MQKTATAAIAATPERPRAQLWLGAALLVLAIVAVYHNTFAVPFLLDDLFSILDNESIHRLGGWWEALTPRSQVYTAGRPLLNLSFALNYAAGGFSVAGYHVVNLLIHVAAALTLAAIVRRVLLRRQGAATHAMPADRVALIAALLWALHPIQTVCVTYVSQRAESLMALFYLLTLYCFLRGAEAKRGAWHALAVLSCVAGMMVKEVMVTAPVVVVLFDRTFLAGSFREAWRQRKGVHLMLAATWIVLAALMATTRVADRGIGFGLSYSWLDYLRIESAAVLHYLRLVAWPFPLVFDYGQETAVPGAAQFAANIVVLGALLALSVRALWRRSAWGFLGCCFFLILAPTSSVVPVAGQPIAENRLYLPLAAAAVAVASSGVVLGRKALAGFVAAALALGLLTIARNRVYASEVSIWADTVAQRPGSARAHLNYASALGRARRVDAAIPEFRAALRISPSYSAAHTQLASAYFEQKRFAEALPHFAAGLALEPNDPMAHSNYGATLFQLGRWNDALGEFLEALRLRPTHPASRVNAAILLAHLGRPAEAIALFEETLRMYPENTAARDNLAQLRAAIQSGTYKPHAGTP